MLMSAALGDVLGTEDVFPDNDSTVDLWNRAWEIGKGKIAAAHLPKA
jgi:hypothetical protein